MTKPMPARGFVIFPGGPRLVLAQFYLVSKPQSALSLFCHDLFAVSVK
jgi:hypothetical protein